MGGAIDAKSDSKNPCMLFKYFYATCLLIFSVIVVVWMIFERKTHLSHDVNPWGVIVIMFGALLWLCMVEGGQGALVGLPPVDRELYKDSHKITYKICSMAHKGDNLDRYLMGRQFLVIFIVFIVEMCGAPIAGETLYWLPAWASNLFLTSGLAMILFTVQLGKVPSQVTASHMMLDYINNYSALFTVYVALALEYSGILHSSYVMAMIVAKLSGKPIESNEPPRNTAQNIFFWLRCAMSLALLGFALAVTLEALFQGQTTMWEGVPNWASVILFFFFMSIVGFLEAMQIAFFAVTKMTKDEQGDHYFAKKTCHLLFKGKGRNLPSFMIGRQLCVTLCFFIIARVTTLNVETGTGENIFGVSDPIQNFFNTGLMGAFVTTILGSIAWQLVASAFPIAILSNPLTYILLWFCLLLEWTGIVAGAWVVAAINKKVRGFKRDEEYVGTPEERAAKKHEDHDENLHVGTGHPRIPVQPAGSGEFDLHNVDDDEEEDAAKKAEEKAAANEEAVEEKV